MDFPLRFVMESSLKMPKAKRQMLRIADGYKNYMPLGCLQVVFCQTKPQKDLVHIVATRKLDRLIFRSIAKDAEISAIAKFQIGCCGK